MSFSLKSVFAFWLAAIIPMLGQSVITPHTDVGTIGGTVLDENGGVIPGALLTLKCAAPCRNPFTVASDSDMGVGLPVGRADEIFNAFFTTKPQGSGMGLAISRSIVESHGGRLWATSHDGRGATFHFTLPTAVVEVSAAT
jgi:hypothetical protein